ncbi:MAG: CCA tRNA nucleotidyltransferase, partial [Pseudomonadota bacterium]
MSEPDPRLARARDLPGLLSDGRLNAPWLRDPALSPVFTSIERAGFTVRAVGGAVRDALRGASDQSATTDVDLATNALPSETQAAAEAAGLKSVPTGIAHGTVTVISDGTPFEVTTLRTDVKTDGRHAEVAFTADWTADAQRRDFTINAIYCDQNGALFDPVGGMADLSRSNLRFIGDAATRIGEDYLRVLRFYRFLAQIPALSTDAAAWPAIEGARHGLALLSAERIHIELRKLLIADGAVAAIDLMRQHGTL